MIIALSGGVGGAKLALGLARVMPPEDLLVVVNTGDDFEHLGLSISPDIDTVAYTLAGLANRELGWGRHDETWSFMETMEALGGETWFRLGDRDVALHVERTRRLAAGRALSAVTADLCRRLGIRSRVVPMSDDPVRTRLRTEEGWLDFQEYFVHRRCEPVVHELLFQGAGAARAHPEFLAALADPALLAIVICPSNPFISVEPILAIPGVRQAMIDSAGADHRGVADHRGPGGEGPDGEDDEGTGAGSQRRNGRAPVSRFAGWLRDRSRRHVGGRFDRRAGDLGANADADDGGPGGSGADGAGRGGGAATPENGAMINVRNTAR